METNLAVIKTFIPTKAFGFLVTSEGKEVFFHKSNFVGEIILGALVEFEYGPAIKMGKPPQAVNIRPVETVETGLNTLASVDTAKAAG
jgi:cold shock CspA family protein